MAYCVKLNWHGGCIRERGRQAGERDGAITEDSVCGRAAGRRRFCAGGRHVAPQGFGQRRRRAPEPAHRLRPGGRPQRNRRHPQQCPVHQAIAAGDAGTARRQYPHRDDAAHRQYRGRHGDRQPAAIRHPGHAHRRDGLGPGRCQEPAGRHAAGDAAPRRRRQRLRGGARLARHRRFPGRGRSRQDHARRSDRRPDLQRRHHRARDRLRPQPADPRSSWRCATPTSPPPSGSPRR